MKCKEHPTYAAMRKPRATMKHPDGCPTCWGLWETKKYDDDNHQASVVVDLSPEEARKIVLSLDYLLSRGGKAAAETGAILRPFLSTLMDKTRQVV